MKIKFTVRGATFLFVIALLLALIFVLFNGLGNIGLEYDELYSINAALGCPDKKIFLNYFKEKFGFCIPLMLMPYSGAPIAIISAISTHLFEPSVWAFRGFNMAILLVSLIIFFIFLYKRLGFKVAALTIFFLTFDVQFIFTHHLEKPTLFPFMLRLAVIGLLLSPPFKYRIFLLGFLAGFSIYTKLDASFFLLSVTIGWILGYLIVLEKRLFLQSLLSNKINKFLTLVQTQLLPFGLGFFIGLYPFIKYFRERSDAVLGVIEVYKQQTVGQTIPIRVDSFFKQLTNSDFFEYVFRQPISLDYITIISAQILIFFWLLAAGYLVVNKRYNKLALTVLGFFVIYLFYPTLAGSHHRLIIYPFPQLVLAIFLTNISGSFKNFYLKNYFLAICLGLYLLVFVPVYTQTMEWGRKTCGTVSFTCAIYPLVENIRNEKKTLVLGDWGMATQILYLTKGKIPIYEAVFDAWLLKPEELKQTMTPYLKSCSSIVLRASKYAKFEAADQKLRALLREDGDYSSEKIYDKNQLLQYEVFRSSKCE